MKLSELAIKKIVQVVLGGKSDEPTYRKLEHLVELFQKYGRDEFYDFEAKEPKNPKTGNTYARKEYTKMALRDLNNTSQMYDFLVEQLNIDIYHNELKAILVEGGFNVEKILGRWIISSVDQSNEKTKVDISFSENRDKIISALNDAKVSIDIAMAWFTSDAFLPILLKKKKEGLRIRIILNDDGVNKTKGCKLEEFEVKMLRGKSGGIMHNKLCIIDNQIVITGSYNWSENAEKRNVENVAIIGKNEIATQASIEFQRLWNMDKN